MYLHMNVFSLKLRGRSVWSQRIENVLGSILPFMGFLGQVLTYNDWCVKRTSFLRTEDAKKNFCVLSTEIFLVKEFSFNIDVYYASYFKENSLVFYMESQQ